MTTILPASQKLAAVLRAAVVLTLLSCFVYIFVVNSYICDDALMIFRSVDNFLSGQGLTWNPEERVQVFTGPLYTLILSIFYFPLWLHRAAYDPTAIYITAMLINFFSSLVGFVALILFCKSSSERVLGATLLFGSQAYTVFTSSGLETSLTNALVIVFYCLWLSRYKEIAPTTDSSARIFACGALLMLNRLDSLIYIFPVIIYEFSRVCFQDYRRAIKSAGIAFLPLCAWILFSIAYYGFPFPTSYYAKLGFGVSQSILWMMGKGYLAQSWLLDPLSLLVIATATLGVILLLFKRGCSHQKSPIIAQLGAVAGVGYIAHIGGDFMGFRFLGAPYEISVIVLIHLIRSSFATSKAIAVSWIVAALAIAYTIFWPWAPAKRWQLHPERMHSSFVDFDISYYYPGSNLLLFLARRQFPVGQFHSVSSAEHCQSLALGQKTVLMHQGGMRAFCSGPNAHTIDQLSITDPLISRLPAATNLGVHLPGHVRKAVPAGYAESLALGGNRIQDPDLAKFYQKLTSVIRGPILSSARWRDIWDLNMVYGGRFRKAYQIEDKPLPVDLR